MIKKYLLGSMCLLLSTTAFSQFNTLSPGYTSTNDRVGIGATNLTQKLTINGGGIGFDWNSSDKKLYSPEDGTLEWMTHIAASGHGFAVSHQGDKKVYLNTSGNSFFTGGNVGIGTKMPSSTLTVSGDMKIESGDNFMSYNGLADICLRYADRGSGGRAIVHDHGNTLVLNCGGDFTGGTRLGTNVYFCENPQSDSNTSYIYSGNLVIGSSDAKGYRLAVNGTIRAQEIRVEAGPWPDQVFEANYQLVSLPKIKSYIERNHHLPGIPSVKEIEKDGASLGEMVKLQIKKIEELTLYLIEKDQEARV